MSERRSSAGPSPAAGRRGGVTCPRCGCRIPAASRGACPQCGLGAEVAIGHAVPSEKIHSLWDHYWRLSRWTGVALALAVAAPLSRVGVKAEGDILFLCLVASGLIWAIRQWGILDFDDAVNFFLYRAKLMLALTGAGLVSLPIAAVIRAFPGPTVWVAGILAVSAPLIQLVLEVTKWRTLREEAPELLAELRRTRLELGALQLTTVVAFIVALVLLDRDSWIDPARLYEWRLL